MVDITHKVCYTIGTAKVLIWGIKMADMKLTKGQTIVIKNKAIYGWRTGVTVKEDDPGHSQVWVEEINLPIKYEDIEPEED